MGKVFIVTEGGFCDYRIVGVFTSIEKANAVKENIKSENPIEEMELDSF